MADIHPFRAFRYANDNASQPVSPAQVVTQPYDKITPALQDRYYAASPYNLVRIILGRHHADDNRENNVYSRAAAYFRDWRQQRVLRQDSQLSLYVYSQRFNLPGFWQRTFEQRRFSHRKGTPRLSSPSAASRTIPPASSSAMNKPWPSPRPTASISSAPPAPTSARFFMLYGTPARSNPCSTLPQNQTLPVTDEYGVVHRVWQVSDPDVIASVRAAMSARNSSSPTATIATKPLATYRNECRKKRKPRATYLSPPPTSNPDFFRSPTILS